ncbi:hypothetical protein FOZ60_010710 [Perkinsus olseni]|uniref:Uncharacterized protein n=1 Tax=Perkinsus olseni TaxID=32597 RepID=A0A7J6PDG4_PEROL|nr:hypothetical protein FOZ60_010710 [Perkinsus olseni]
MIPLLFLLTSCLAVAEAVFGGHRRSSIGVPGIVRASSFLQALHKEDTSADTIVRDALEEFVGRDEFYLSYFDMSDTMKERFSRAHPIEQDVQKIIRLTLRQYDGYVDEVNTAMRQGIQIYGRDVASFTQKILMPQVEEDDLILAKKAQQMTGVTLKLLKLLQKEQRHKTIGTQTMLDLIGSEFKQLQQAYSKPTEFRKSESLNEYLKAAFGEIPGDASIDERVRLINKHIAEKTATGPVEAAEHEHAAVAKVMEELEDYTPGEEYSIHPAGTEDAEDLDLDAVEEEQGDQGGRNEESEMEADDEELSFLQLGSLDASFRMGSLTYQVELLNNEGRLLELAKFIAPQMDYTVMGTFDVGVSKMDKSEDIDTIAHKPEAEKLVSADGEELVYSGDGDFDISAATASLSGQDADSAKQKYDESLARVAHLLKDDEMADGERTREEETQERGENEEESQQGEHEEESQEGREQEEPQRAVQDIDEAQPGDEEEDEEEGEGSFIEIAKRRRRRTRKGESYADDDEGEEESFIEKKKKAQVNEDYDEDEEEEEDEESFIQKGKKGGQKARSSFIEQKVAKRILVRKHGEVPDELEDEEEQDEQEGTEDQDTGMADDREDTDGHEENDTEAELNYREPVSVWRHFLTPVSAAVWSSRASDNTTHMLWRWLVDEPPREMSDAALGNTHGTLDMDENEVMRKQVYLTGVRAALRLSMADKRVRGLIDARMLETLNKEWKSILMDDLVTLVAVNWKRAWNHAGVSTINEEVPLMWADPAGLSDLEACFGRLLKTYIKEAVMEAQEYVKNKHTATDLYSRTLEKAITQLSTMFQNLEGVRAAIEKWTVDMESRGEETRSAKFSTFVSKECPESSAVNDLPLNNRPIPILPAEEFSARNCHYSVQGGPVNHYHEDGVLFESYIRHPRLNRPNAITPRRDFLDIGLREARGEDSADVKICDAFSSQGIEPKMPESVTSDNDDEMPTEQDREKQFQEFHKEWEERASNPDGVDEQRALEGTAENTADDAESEGKDQEGVEDDE